MIMHRVPSTCHVISIGHVSTGHVSIGHVSIGHVRAHRRVAHRNDESGQYGEKAEHDEKYKLRATE